MLLRVPRAASSTLQTARGRELRGRDASRLLRQAARRGQARQRPKRLARSGVHRRWRQRRHRRRVERISPCCACFLAALVLPAGGRHRRRVLRARRRLGALFSAFGSTRRASNLSRRNAQRSRLRRPRRLLLRRHVSSVSLREVLQHALVAAGSHALRDARPCVRRRLVPLVSRRRRNVNRLVEVIAQAALAPQVRRAAARRVARHGSHVSVGWRQRIAFNI